MLCVLSLLDSVRKRTPIVLWRTVYEKILCTGYKQSNGLGYWIKFKILKAYFDKAADKHQAVKDILTVKDYHALLKASAYFSK